MIGESYDLGTADGQFSRSYEYNNAGNRTVKYEDGVRTNYSYATLSSQHTNQLSTAAVVGGQTTKYLYDAMGNLTAAFVDSNSNNTFDTASENGKAYAWNLAGQLTQVKVWSSGTNTDTAQYTYAHNGTGQLLDRTVNGVTTRFHWNDFSPYLEEDDSGDAEYSFFGSSLRFDLGSNNVIDTSDDAHFFIKDEAGNVIAVADEDGALETQFEYDVWGNDLNNSFDNAQDINCFRSGKYFDPISDLYYNQARWYDPQQGRFISESPIAPFAEEEYAYCHNDPVNYVDVNGLIGEKVIDAAEEKERQMREIFPEGEDNRLDPDTGRCLEKCISVGYQAGIELANPEPIGEILLAYSIRKFVGRIWRLTGLLRKSIRNIPIKDLVRTHSLTRSKGSFRKLMNDIKTNGIKEPIKYVVSGGKKYVVDGHHRLSAAKRLGMKTIPSQEVKLPYKGYKTVKDLDFDQY